MSERRTTPSANQAPRSHLLKMLIPLALLLGIVVGVSIVLLRPSTHSAALPNGAVQQAPGRSGYEGTLALPARAAPAIDLRNDEGRRVTLAQYRGRAVLVTFLYAHCPDVCPLIASNLRVALARLGPEGRHVQLIAVSVDPRGDTPGSVAAFLAAHGLTGRMQYLIGSAAELSPVWSAWSVGSSREVGKPDLVAHSALVYGITASGALTTIYPATFEPSELVHDVPRLAAH